MLYIGISNSLSMVIMAPFISLAVEGVGEMVYLVQMSFHLYLMDDAAVAWVAWVVLVFWTFKSLLKNLFLGNYLFLHQIFLLIH